MSRRGENIYKRKDGRWEGRYIKGYAPDKKQFMDMSMRNHTEK